MTTLNTLANSWWGKARIGPGIPLQAQRADEHGALAARRVHAERPVATARQPRIPRAAALARGLRPAAARLPAFTASVCNLNPSRGACASARPTAWMRRASRRRTPLDRRDRLIAAESLHLTRRIVGAAGARATNPREFCPACSSGDADLRAWPATSAPPSSTRSAPRRWGPTIRPPWSIRACAYGVADSGIARRRRQRHAHHHQRQHQLADADDRRARRAVDHRRRPLIARHESTRSALRQHGHLPGLRHGPAAAGLAARPQPVLPAHGRQAFLLHALLPGGYALMRSSPAPLNLAALGVLLLVALCSAGLILMSVAYLAERPLAARPAHRRRGARALARWSCCRWATRRRWWCRPLLNSLLGAAAAVAVATRRGRAPRQTCCWCCFRSTRCRCSSSAVRRSSGRWWRAWCCAWASRWRCCMCRRAAFRRGLAAGARTLRTPHRAFAPGRGGDPRRTDALRQPGAAAHPPGWPRCRRCARCGADPPCRAERAADRERHRRLVAGESERGTGRACATASTARRIRLRFSAWRVDWDGGADEQVIVTDGPCSTTPPPRCCAGHATS